MKKQQIIKYWLNSSMQDFKAMNNLYKNGYYIWALFLGHLVLEKTLKAFYIQEVDQNIPHTHDLLKIANKASLELTEDRKDLLDIVTTFNIRARYPDYKDLFYKKANREFTTKYTKDIKEFRKWLLEKIKKS